ncbi:MAG: peptidoglycan-binding protein [Oceanospirillaceae bacterium]
MSQASNKIFALIVATAKEIKRAQRAGDQASVAKLEAFREELKRKEASVVLMDAAQAASELSELAAILQRSKKDIDENVNSLYLGDLNEASTVIEEEATKLHEETRLASADEESGEDGHHKFVEQSNSKPLTDLASKSNIKNAELSARPPLNTEQYQNCFMQMELKKVWQTKADNCVSKMVDEHACAKYRKVEQMTGVPWWFIAILHMLETSQNFNAHLHNGDRLSAKTVRVPKGRPSNWQKGMSWEQSAADALINGGKKLHEVTDWSIGNALQLMERFNGLGYRKRNYMSPYLWSGCTYYEMGKYVKDGVFDANKTSEQVGCALLINRLAAKGYISISAKRQVTSMPAAVLGNLSFKKANYAVFKHAKQEIEFPLTANAVIDTSYGATNPSKNQRMGIKRIQEWCCLHQCNTGIDCDFGPSTQAAVKLFQHRKTLPETGVVDRQTWTMLTAPMRKAIASIEGADNLNNTVLSVAKQHLAQVPKEVGGNNKGPWVRLYMNGKEGNSQRWCAGFVCAIVNQAAANLGGSCPFKRQVGVDALVKDAKNSGRFISEPTVSNELARKNKVALGSLFVIRKSHDDWIHVGIVTNVEAERFLTIEGNTNGDNVDGGNATYSSRGFKNKDFLQLI